MNRKKSVAERASRDSPQRVPGSHWRQPPAGKTTQTGQDRSSWRPRGSTPCIVQEADEISVHDSVDVGGRVPARTQQPGEIGQIRDRVQVLRTLFAAKFTIEIRTDTAVPGIAGQLADVI